MKIVPIEVKLDSLSNRQMNFIDGVYTCTFKLRSDVSVRVDSLIKYSNRQVLIKVDLNPKLDLNSNGESEGIVSSLTAANLIRKNTNDRHRDAWRIGINLQSPIYSFHIVGTDH